jgi:hypothetical protein
MSALTIYRSSRFADLKHWYDHAWFVDAASAVAPTFTVHPLPPGAPVMIVLLTVAAAAHLLINVRLRFC